MIRFLQRQKAKKGFTIIELIVVIAILGVMLAVILPSISQRRSRINEASSAARDFYAAVQTVMNYLSVFDGQILPDEAEDNDVVHYYRNMGGNYPFSPDSDKDAPYPDETVMYIMLHAKNRNIEEVGIVTKEKTKNEADNGLFQLLKREEKDRNTRFGDIFKGEIDDRVSFNDGYYYAMVVFNYSSGYNMGQEPEDPYLSTIKVEYTAFCRKEFPSSAGSDFAAYRNSNLSFGRDNVISFNGGEICGTCATLDETRNERVGYAGTTLT